MMKLVMTEKDMTYGDMTEMVLIEKALTDLVMTERVLTERVMTEMGSHASRNLQNPRINQSRKLFKKHNYYRWKKLNRKELIIIYKNYMKVEA